jgi:hypothetical protein
MAAFGRITIDNDRIKNHLGRVAAGQREGQVDRVFMK